MEQEILNTLGKTKKGSTKTLLAIFGVLILLGAVIIGIVLVGQKQLLQQKAVCIGGGCPGTNIPGNFASCGGTNYCQDECYDTDGIHIGACVPQIGKCQNSSPCNAGGGGGGGPSTGTSTGTSTNNTSNTSNTTSTSGGTTSGGSSSSNATNTTTTTQTSTLKICGQTCTKDSDCALTSGGNYKTICAQQSDGTKKCANPNCPTDTTYGTICSCQKATQTCGQICGDQGAAGGGLYPLCTSGSSCGPLTAQCSLTGTYCLPTNPSNGYNLQACTGANSQYSYLVDSNGNSIGTQSQLKQACAQGAQLASVATTTPSQTASPTSTPTSTSTPAPTKMPIPITGFDTPTILLVSLGAMFILTSLYLFVH